MKKAFWRLASVLGLAVVILAAAASNTGEDLIYTIPISVCGCLLCFVGVIQARRIKAQQPTIHNASAAYRLGFRRNIKCSWIEKEK